MSTPAGNMKPRPRFRSTIRVRLAANLYHDRKRRRFVVYRRAGGVLRKTSVRYASIRTKAQAYALAAWISDGLHAVPERSIKKCVFNTLKHGWLGYWIAKISADAEEWE